MLDDENGEIGHGYPSVISNHQAVLFVVGRGTASSRVELAALALETGEITRLGLAGTRPRYVPTGHLVYVADDRTLRAVPFDPDRLEVLGSPVTLVEDVMVTPSGDANVRITDTGRLIYISGADVGSSSAELVTVDREGQTISRVASRLSGPQHRLSPDGSRVAYQVDGDLWIHDFESSTNTRLTENGGSFPVWAPGGSAITFSSNRAGGFDLYTRPVDVSGPPTLLLDVDDAVVPGSWTPDGQTLVYYAVNGETQRDLWTLRIGEDPSPFLVTEFSESNPRLSPDGRWVAYASDQTGENRIYVKAFPDGGPAIPVSTGPGTQALWSRDGQSIFYRTGNQVWEVGVQTNPGLKVGESRVLFDEPYMLSPANAGMQTYDVLPDGQQFLMVSELQTSAELTVVLNWFEELKARVPTGR